MPQLKEFAATGNFRTDNSGYSAFETFGRRVGGQYDQAGNDLRDIGRAKAAVTTMIGRWPFNIIELEQRAADTAAARARGEAASTARSAGGGGSVNLPRYSRDGRQRNPSRGAHDQMSEGAAALGRELGGMGGTMSPEYRRAIQAQQDAEQKRQNQLDDAAAAKRWDLYEQGFTKYKQDLQNWTNQTEGMNARNGEIFNSPVQSSSQGDDMVGVGFEYPPTPINTEYPEPAPSWNWSSPSSWFSSTPSDTSGL